MKKKIWFAVLLACLALFCLLVLILTPKRMCGVCYGPFRNGQSPDKDIFPSKGEITADITFLSKKVTAIRTYGSGNTLEVIPSVCDKAGIGLYMGIWLGRDKEANKKEMEAGIRLAQEKHKSIKGIIVGSEVLQRKDLSEDDLIGYIQEVKKRTNIPVTTAEIAKPIIDHPKVAAAVDFLFLHIYPYWEAISEENGMSCIFETYDMFSKSFPGKQVIIGETGWPTAGDKLGGAIPSESNQAKYLKEFVAKAKEKKIKYFYFEAFDESWKDMFEGKVGSHWGIWYSDGRIKPGIKPFVTSSGGDGITRSSLSEARHSVNEDTGLPFPK